MTTRVIEDGLVVPKGARFVRVPRAWELPEQEIERAGTKAGNKGWDAAVTAVEMVALGRALDDAGL